MMLNKPRGLQSWAPHSLISEPTRIELKQDILNADITPMFKATALEAKNDQLAQSFLPGSGLNPMTPFRHKTQRGIGLFERTRFSESTIRQFPAIGNGNNSSLIKPTTSTSMMSSLLSTPVIVKKKASSIGKHSICCDLTRKI